MMKIKRKKNTISITFDNRRESAATLRTLGMTLSANHLDDMQDMEELPGMTPTMVHKLHEKGIFALSELKASLPDLIADVTGATTEMIDAWYNAKGKTA